MTKYGAVPPYRETHNYVTRITNAVGAAGPRPKRIVKTVEIVNGREVIKFSSEETPASEFIGSQR